METMFDIEKLLDVPFENLEKDIYNYICNIGKWITTKLLCQIDEYLMLNRDRERYISKQMRKTTVKTVYGEVEYRRRMYYDEKTGNYTYLLEDSMQMEKVGTVSTNLAKMIAEAVIDMPYRKAATAISQNTGQVISSHGVWNVAQQIGTLIHAEERKNTEKLKAGQTDGAKESKIIFMESDGIYINMQKNKKKVPSMELKASTVYDGWSSEGTRLHNKIIFAGMAPAASFNLKTEALTRSVFDTDAVELRILNGDGAAWIKNTYDPDMIFQLDRYHIKQEIRRCIGEKHIRRRIYRQFENNKPDEMLETIETYINSIDDGTDEDKTDKAKRLYTYLSNNYDGLLPWQLQVGKIPEAPEGITYKSMGIQENQNCSYFCIRMKGRKMRWSESGADNMAKLIYTRENGMLDAVIEKSESKLLLPVMEPETDSEILSAAKIKNKIGTGNKWMELIQGDIPVLYTANGAISNVIRNIINGK